MEDDAFVLEYIKKPTEDLTEKAVSSYNLTEAISYGIPWIGCRRILKALSEERAWVTHQH